MNLTSAKLSNLALTVFLFLLFSQLKVPTTDKPGVSVNFRKLLLNRCQKEFEKDKDDDVIFERKQKELDAASVVRADSPGEQSAEGPG